MSESRFIDIEVKLSHQEVLIEELNEVVRTQQETIDRMENLLKSFFKKFRDGDGGGGQNEIGPGNEKPPHY